MSVKALKGGHYFCNDEELEKQMLETYEVNRCGTLVDDFFSKEEIEFINKKIPSTVNKKYIWNDLQPIGYYIFTTYKTTRLNQLQLSDMKNEEDKKILNMRKRIYDYIKK